MKNFYDSKDIPCFGVAGNFTGHLEQAGEAIDFANVKTVVHHRLWFQLVQQGIHPGENQIFCKTVIKLL